MTVWLVPAWFAVPLVAVVVVCYLVSPRVAVRLRAVARAVEAA